MLRPMRLALCFLAALVLTGCITSGDSSSFYRCDRNGDEHQRRAC